MPVCGQLLRHLTTDFGQPCGVRWTPPGCPHPPSHDGGCVSPESNQFQPFKGETTYSTHQLPIWHWRTSRGPDRWAIPKYRSGPYRLVKSSGWGCGLDPLAQQMNNPMPPIRDFPPLVMVWRNAANYGIKGTPGSRSPAWTTRTGHQRLMLREHSALPGISYGRKRANRASPAGSAGLAVPTSRGVE
jgi:hypothetical protein